ncbi:imelysin family protein [Ramlibacter sp. AN1015]|uniref:imelysin family protein n=1 Tax=Ramlibacter sp. AN1015 TaxID=3133428 RepID=UPI0030C0DBEA
MKAWPVFALAGAVGALSWTAPAPSQAAASSATSSHAAPAGPIAQPTATAYAEGLYRHWFAPRAREFAEQAATLPPALQAYCEAPADRAPAALQRARAAWRSAAVTWDTLSAVPLGPLVGRRSAMRIDFSPARPAMIERALRTAPADLPALERVGTPAKGFPALEWLLWTRPAWPQTPGCRYAVLLARDIDHEARALREAFAELAARDWASDEAGARAAMEQAMNQWIGGLERLRWTHMEKPQRAGRPDETPAFPRMASGGTASSWGARWRALQALGVSGELAGAAKPSRPIALEATLRGRGSNALADRLAQASAQATRELARAEPTDAQSVLAAANAMAALKRLAETDVAAALDIQIGFSDNDGD